jgi:hypothetical protein
MKLYILIKDSIDLGHAVNSAAHASLMGHLAWSGDEIYDDWEKSSFKKVVCAVSDREFDDAKKYDDHLVVTESTMDGREVGLVFKPREEWPKRFKFYKLYK